MKSSKPLFLAAVTCALLCGGFASSGASTAFASIPQDNNPNTKTVKDVELTRAQVKFVGRPAEMRITLTPDCTITSTSISYVLRILSHLRTGKHIDITFKITKKDKKTTKVIVGITSVKA